LTAARAGEVLGARWSELDLGERVCTIPANRMKARREHRVPLSDEALAVLRAVLSSQAEDAAAFVFPGQRGDRPLSAMAMTMLLRRMNESAPGEPKEGPPRWRDRMGAAVVPHGFRSSFRDWCAEATDTPHAVAEAALAHTVGDKVVAAYQRGDMFQKRRDLMDRWGRYCAGG
jgi:integrase